MILSLPAQLPGGLPVPMDVRLTNALARACLALGVAGLLAAGWAWVTQPARFPLKAIEVENELERISLPTIKVNALPRMSGGFFNLDLQQARAAFEAVPWVRHAVVRRVWPGQLSVTLEEHQPVALWRSGDEETPDRLVNSHGEVFEANLGDVEDLKLPSLEGPEGSARLMLDMLQGLSGLFTDERQRLLMLHLSGRGSWRAHLTGDVRLELGRGTPDEVMARLRRYLDTAPAISARLGAPVLAADLRHDDGFALRLRGVTTAPLPSAKPPVIPAARPRPASKGPKKP